MMKINRRTVMRGSVVFAGAISAVGRPGEGGPGTGETSPKGSFDIVPKNFEEFADKMGT